MTVNYPDYSKASCDGIDTEIFFPIGAAQAEENKELIKTMCHSCPVFEDCLNYSLAIKVDGLWAGTDENERKKMRAERGIKAITIGEDYEREWLLSQTPDAVNSRKHRALKAAETQRKKKEEQTA